MYPMFRTFRPQIKTFRVQKEVEFDAGHRVPLHASKCRNPHGHRYRVRATVEGPLHSEGSSTGMVMDFGDLKALLTEHVHDRYDHGFIVWEGDDAMLDGLGGRWTEGWKVILEPWHPTAENMAAAIHANLAPQVRALGAKLISIDVWETPTSVATYPGQTWT